MSGNPLISVIIPLYDRKKLVAHTIASVINQTYQHWELLLVDDGSTDGSLAYINTNFAFEKRIRTFQRSRGPKGANTCRNIGLGYSKGDYVIFFDSDDLMAPFCLERRADYIRRFPEADFLVFNTLLFKEHPGDFNYLWNVHRNEDDLSRFLRLDGVWPIYGPVHKKHSLLRNSIAFDENLPFWQDYDFHVRYLIKEPSYLKFLGIEPDCYCRRHNLESTSQKSFGKDAVKANAIKEQILWNFYDLLKRNNSMINDHKNNLAVNYINIIEKRFREKHIFKSYGLLFKLLWNRFILPVDFLFVAIKLPLIILELKRPGPKLLDRFENLLKPWVSKKVNFPENSIHKVETTLELRQHS